MVDASLFVFNSAIYNTEKEEEELYYIPLYQQRTVLCCLVLQFDRCGSGNRQPTGVTTVRVQQEKNKEEVETNNKYKQRFCNTFGLSIVSNTAQLHSYYLLS